MMTYSLSTIDVRQCRRRHRQWRHQILRRVSLVWLNSFRPRRHHCKQKIQTDLVHKGNYINHLNTRLIWYSNGWFVSGCQMVRYSIGGLKTWLRKPVYGPKCPVFEWSAKPLNFTIWILGTNIVRYSAELGIQVIGIQMVTVFYKIATGPDCKCCWCTVLWFVQVKTFQIQWGSEYWTSLVFEWLKIGVMPNGLVFECHLNTGQPNHLNTGQMDAILFSFVLVQYSNGPACT